MQAYYSYSLIIVGMTLFSIVTNGGWWVGLRLRASGCACLSPAPALLSTAAASPPLLPLTLTHLA